MTRAVGAVLLACVVAAPVGAQEELFLEGNRLYQENDFEGALAAYLRVEEAGFEAGALFYNIANAYFKTGELGRSILYYERAARLLPGDADVRENLTLARSLTVDDIDPLPRFWLLDLWDGWVSLLPRAVLFRLVLLAYSAAGSAAVLLILTRSEGLRRVASRAAVVAGAVTILFGANLVLRELGVGQPEEAVVMVEETPAQSAPAADPNLTVFSVHEGTKVRVDRRSEGWAEIVLEDGRVGWVPVDAITTI